jgi:hypothetical protein
MADRQNDHRGAALKAKLDCAPPLAALRQGETMTSTSPSPITDLDAMQAWFGGRIPIVIGTVGHRDLSTTDKIVVKAVRRECQRMRKKYPATPFLVLSGLAEGADRLIARIVTEELGATLVAVLPFPAADFCADFPSEDSRQEFADLMGRSAATFDVHLPSDEQWKQAGKMRDEQYARVGALIAEQSQILLAVWNGRPARGVGGTADVVGWFERGYAPAEYSLYAGDLSLLDPPQPGLSVRIDPETGAREIHNAPPRTRRYGLRPSSIINDILRRTNVFNRDVQRQAASSVNKNPLVPNHVLARIPITEASAAFEEADALAIYYAQRVKLADIVLYSLALTAVFAFSSIDAKPLASWTFLGVMGVMALLALHVWGRSLDTKFQEYRSFAEAMRILFFWRMLGLQRQVWLSYLSKHGTVVRWLRHAVRALEFTQDRRLSAPHNSIASEELNMIARTRWIDSQIRYYGRAGAKCARDYRRWTWVGRVAIVLTFATSALLAAMTFSYSDGLHAWRHNAQVIHPFGTIPIDSFIRQLQTLVGLAAAAGVATKGFLDRRADQELARQYASTRQKFELADDAISEIPTNDPDRQIPELFGNLGREALQEQSEWLWLRHSRPFEAPS